MRTPSGGTALGGLALFVALGGTGYAVIAGGVPDSQGVFHACVHKGNGKLRIVKTDSECKRKSKKHPGELAVEWNQRGPQGRPGANGVDGANGINGVNGTNGVDGRNGDGAGVISRVRGTTQVNTTTSPQQMTISSGSWTQAANELNQFLGQVVVDPPPQSGCSTDNGAPGFPVVLPGNATINVKVNGTSIGSAVVMAADAGDTTTLLSLNALFEPGAATGRTMTVEVSDNCGTGVGGTGTATTRFAVKSVSINVIGLR